MKKGISHKLANATSLINTIILHMPLAIPNEKIVIIPNGNILKCPFDNTGWDVSFDRPSVMRHQQPLFSQNFLSPNAQKGNQAEYQRIS